MSRRALVTFLALVAFVALAAGTAGCGGAASDAGSSPRGETAATATHDPSRRFLARYVAQDGRVVRHDQGGDTVSEGQAYAMLIAVAIRDRATFARVWRWTRRELQRADGALAWHWRDGRIVDPQPATDADLDAARALRLAAQRFDVPAYARASRRLVRVIRRDMVADGRLLPGPWAREDRWFNPSYVSPRAARTLGLDAARARGIRVLLRGGKLPPDWAREDRPTGAPRSGKPPAYGYDAVRLPVRLAESCERADRALAARLWRTLHRNAGRVPRALDGAPLPNADLHPVALVGAAGAAHAAGARGHARRLLTLAARRDDAHPTYYGAAWAALGREMLITRRLGRC